jgi:hypothetical protein
MDRPGAQGNDDSLFGADGFLSAQAQSDRQAGAKADHACDAALGIAITIYKTK